MAIYCFDLNSNKSERATKKILIHIPIYLLSKYPPVVLPHEEGVYSDEVELFVNPKISGEKAVGLSPSANVASSHLQTK